MSALVSALEWRLQPRSSVLDLQPFDRDFAALPAAAFESAYGGKLLPAAMWHGFLTMPVPFATEFWLAFAGERPVGRIGANISPTRPHTGYIGFFEVVDGPNAAAQAATLLQAATAWLHKQGATRAVGPVDFSTWFNYRLRVPNLPEEAAGPTTPRAWEPATPPRYVDYFSAAGFAECMRYSSSGLTDLAAMAEATLENFAYCHRKGYRFQQLDAAALQAKIPEIYAMSLRGFAANYLFEPITLEAFQLLYAPLAAQRLGIFAHIAYAPDGDAAGFFLSFADGDDLILKSVTVLPEHQSVGLSNALVHLNCAVGAQAGLLHPTVALVRSGARSQSYGRKSTPRWTHSYALFDRQLA